MPTNKRTSVSTKVSSYSSTISRPGRPIITSKIVNPKKVIASKKLSSSSSNDGKSCSTGAISTKKQEKPRKVTKSDVHFKKFPGDFDFCKKCGDSCEDGANNRFSKDRDVETMVSTRKKPSTTVKDVGGKLPRTVQQYYKNEHFKPSTESLGATVNGIKKLSLDTIKEVAEAKSDSIFHVFDSDDGSLDSEDNLEDLKEFREKNYFECHSADTRIKTKASATTLKDHKCVYRFYLNDRLFPVPLCTDHTKEIRCIECLLPMSLQVGSEGKVNGTIQAKVTLGKKNQDVMILLPVSEPLIIHEKRKEIVSNKETLFFGLINLDKMGHSVFNSTLPENSFALKYQKGFQEFENFDDYVYNDLDKDDVIVV